MKSVLNASHSIGQAQLDRLSAAGIAKQRFEFEKAHTYPASQPFFDPMSAEEALSELPSVRPPFWAYVHVPYCNYQCTFCFYRKQSSTTVDKTFASYASGVTREIDHIRSLTGQDRLPIHDLYVGGGTPTALDTRQLEALFDLLIARLDAADDCLSTIEASPESLTDEKAELIATRGFERVSIGAQSLQESRLEWAGRQHSVRDITTAYEQLRRSGCTHINIDLIYGYPGQTVDEWEVELRAALRVVQPESLTLYYLRYVTGTVLERFAFDPQRKSWLDLIRMRQVYFDVLSDAGYEMCRPHHFRLSTPRVRRYRGAPTLDHGNDGAQLGFGPSAFSHVGRVVSRNALTLAAWNGAVNSQGFGTLEGRRLTGADCDTRTAIKSLAAKRRLDRAAFLEEQGHTIESAFPGKFERLIDLELVEADDEGYRLTDLGVLVDEEVSYFLYPGGFRLQ